MDRRLRILHISTRLILGGSQENTVLSCEGQARRGHEVHLAFGPIYGPEGSMLERVERFNREAGRLPESGQSSWPDDKESGGRTAQPGKLCHPITCHEVPHLVREISPVADWRCLRELRALIRDIRPDVVHTHSSKAGILGRAAAWGRDRGGERHGGAEAPRHRGGGPSPRRSPRGEGGGMGVVHTIHGPPFHGSLPGWKNALYAAAERWAARRCHVIVSVADAMTEQYLARGIGREEQYATVHSGMEIERYLHAAPGETRDAVRAELGFGSDDFVIGTVARLAEHKGHDDVLDALGAELRAHETWKLLWVGDGWWRERLLDRVREMGLEGRVVTTGLVPSERVPAMMRAMDLLVHPSYREGLPRTVPQALLCGTPVVASDADGTPEVCIDWDTGRLFPVGDVARLREAVAWMFEHAEERRAMASRGLALCREQFSAERMVEGLEAVYARALGPWGRA